MSLVRVIIDGVGDASGPALFTPQSGGPLLLYGAGTWVPVMRGLPDVLSEQVPWHGGCVQEQGSLEIELLGTQLGGEPCSIGALSSALAAGATTLQAQLGASIEVPSVLWLGAEAVRVTADLGGGDYTVERGWLRTLDVDHAEGSEVYCAVPHLQGRTARLQIGDRLIGTYVVTEVEGLDDEVGIRIVADSRHEWLDRILPVAPAWDVRSGASRGYAYVVPETEEQSEAVDADVWLPVGDTTFTLAAEDGAALRLRWSPGAGPRQIRDAHEWEHDDEGADSDAVRYTRACWVAAGDFRRGTVVGSRAGWEPVSHVVDVVLCVLTSSRRPSDNLHLQNAFPGPVNYSGLPPGFGLGVPAEQIDLASFEACRTRLGALAVVDDFVLGGDPKTAREWLDLLLVPFGLVLHTEGGVLRLLLPRDDLGSEETLGVDDVRMRARSGPPRLSQRLDSESLAEVQLRLGHYRVEQKITWADFALLYDPAELFGAEGTSKEVAAPVSPERASEVERAAMRRLWRGYRPARVLELDCDPRVLDWDIGDTATLDLPGLRGSPLRVQMQEREPVLDPDRGLFARCVWRAVPPVDQGVIAPASLVSAVSQQGSSAFICTVDTTDGWVVGDAVKLRDAEGLDLGGGTAVVSNVGVGTLTVTLNFTGQLQAGRWLCHAGDHEHARVGMQYGEP